MPLASHQHQNGTQASRSEPAQGKRSASLVSSTAQEAKEDLLAGDLELLSGHLEKAKRCHIHVTSADTSASAAAVQSRPMATQHARPAPESPSVSQQRAAPAKASQIHQSDVNYQRWALHLLSPQLFVRWSPNPLHEGSQSVVALFAVMRPSQWAHQSSAVTGTSSSIWILKR